MRTRLNIICLLLLLSSGSLNVFSQQQTPAASLPVDPDSKKIMYRGVVDQPGTMAILYVRAIEWFGYYYVNAD